jgi:hypothetical protein
MNCRRARDLYKTNMVMVMIRSTNDRKARRMSNFKGFEKTAVRKMVTCLKTRKQRRWKRRI